MDRFLRGEEAVPYGSDPEKCPHRVPLQNRKLRGQRQSGKPARPSTRPGRPDRGNSLDRERGSSSALIILVDDPTQELLDPIPKDPPYRECHKEESQKPLEDQTPDSRVQIGKSIIGSERKGKSRHPKKIFEVLHDSLPGGIDSRHSKHPNRFLEKESFEFMEDRINHPSMGRKDIMD